jgi:hypothetical protein
MAKKQKTTKAILQGWEPSNEDIRVMQLAFSKSGWHLTRRQCIHILLVNLVMETTGVNIMDCILIKGYMEKNTHLY